MRISAWIVGILLLLNLIPSALAQRVEPAPAQAQSIPAQLTRLPERLISLPGQFIHFIVKLLPYGNTSVTSDDAAPASPGKYEQDKQGDLSAAERLQLRQDVNEVGREFYRQQRPTADR